MRSVVLLALNDLRLTLRDRPAFIWTIALPIAMMWFLGGIGGDSGVQPIALSILNHDDGWLSRALIEDLSGEGIELRALTPGALPEASETVRTLIVPAGFTERVLRGERQVLRLEAAPDASPEFSLAAQVRITRVIVRAVARLVRLREGAGAPERQAEEFRELGLEEPSVRLVVSQAGRGRPVPSGRAQSVPGILTMTVLMMTLIYGAVFLTVEKRIGMLRRQAALPLRRGQLVAGKLLGRLFIAAFQIVALLAAGRFLFGVSWGSSPVGLGLVVGSYAIAVAGLATLLGAILRDAHQASSVGWIIGMVLAAVGGCWWPAEVMPRWLFAVAHVLPTAWAMDGFHALISFGRGLPAVLLPAAVLLGFGALFSIAAARFLRFDV